MLGLHFCARAFSSCGERGPLFIAVHGPLTVAASLVAEHRVQMRRLSSCGSRAQLLCGMWDLPRPGLEPVSPALAGGFSTTAPPGKPSSVSWLQWWLLESTHVIKWHRTLHMYCTNVNLLVLIIYYSYARYNHWGKLGEGTQNHTVTFLQLPVNL